MREKHGKVMEKGIINYWMCEEKVDEKLTFEPLKAEDWLK